MESDFLLVLVLILVLVLLRFLAPIHAPKRKKVLSMILCRLADRQVLAFIVGDEMASLGS
jgi:hypothetical protein